MTVSEKRSSAMLGMAIRKWLARLSDCDEGRVGPSSSSPGVPSARGKSDMGRIVNGDPRSAQSTRTRTTLDSAFAGTTKKKLVIPAKAGTQCRSGRLRFACLDVRREQLEQLVFLIGL